MHGNRSVMATMAGILLGIGMVLSGCGSVATAIPPNTVLMSNDNFVNTSLTVPAGTGVTFTSPQYSGGLHLLATGRDAHFEREPGAPAAFNVASGVRIQNGDSQTFIFATPGVYHIMCVVHPSMNLTITVT